MQAAHMPHADHLLSLPQPDSKRLTGKQGKSTIRKVVEGAEAAPQEEVRDRRGRK